MLTLYAACLIKITSFMSKLTLTIITSFFIVAPGPFQSEIGTRLVFMQDGTPEMDIQFKVRTYVQQQWQ